MAGNRLMILVEAQSTWSVNITVRFLLYLADTYSRYIEKNNLDLYRKKKIELPIPELYVIYTGTGEHPETISLSRDIFGKESCAVEVKAKVIRESAEGDILNQYITFTRIFDEQIGLHGRSRKAVEETLRICREMNVLKTYFEEEEVADIMFTFMDKEQILQRYIESERREGREEGVENTTFNAIHNLMKNTAWTAKQAMDALGLTEEEQAKYAARL